MTVSSSCGNIGGVVIIDFIDMESRRDQFCAAGHFTRRSG